MSKLIISAFILALTAACSSTPAVSVSNTNQNSNTPQVKVETKNTPLKVAVNLKLSARENKELDKSIPSKVRELLENAEDFEILAQIERKDGKIVYPSGEISEVKPNIKTSISDARLRKEVLESFYRDVAKGVPPAICYEPHHILRARRGDQMIEMEICFSCSRFEGKGAFGEFSGTTGRGDEKTENLFNRIIEKDGIEIK